MFDVPHSQSVKMNIVYYFTVLCVVRLRSGDRCLAENVISTGLFQNAEPDWASGQTLRHQLRQAPTLPRLQPALVDITLAVLANSDARLQGKYADVEHYGTPTTYHTSHYTVAAAAPIHLRT